jgi:hypothetical protein
MKTCSKCGKIKPLELFHKDNKAKSSVDTCCKVCHSQKTKIYQKLNPRKLTQKNARWKRDNIDHVRDVYYKKKYGISLYQYNELHKLQNGCCALCKQLEKLPKSRLGVDHCHDSGRIRGLLCDLCNTALGRLGDSPESIERVLKYVKGV